jgi:hypothetical protein
LVNRERGGIRNIEKGAPIDEHRKERRRPSEEGFTSRDWKRTEEMTGNEGEGRAGGEHRGQGAPQEVRGNKSQIKKICFSGKLWQAFWCYNEFCNALVLRTSLKVKF